MKFQSNLDCYGKDANGMNPRAVSLFWLVRNKNGHIHTHWYMVTYAVLRFNVVRLTYFFLQFPDQAHILLITFESNLEFTTKWHEKPFVFMGSVSFKLNRWKFSWNSEFDRNPVSVMATRNSMHNMGVLFVYCTSWHSGVVCQNNLYSVYLIVLWDMWV